jgi:outer membrane lipopolysaccharide assembly protein LptE/RlpB
MKLAPATGAAAIVLAAVLAAGCGYHVAGRGDLLPHTIHTIAIPAFSNSTSRYRLSERLPTAISREFLSRTRYRVVPDPNTADAVLQGTVVRYNSNPTIFDPATGRASAVQMSVVLDVTLRERATGAVLYSRSQLEFRERYEISVDQTAYFEESDSALERLSRDVARNLVSAVLEKF